MLLGGVKLEMQPYQTSLGPQLEVWSSLEGQTVLVKGDPDRRLQIIGNLLENAIKNTSLDQRNILVTFEVLSQIVRMQITDNGAGIAPGDLLRIFEPFTAIPTQYSVGGTGIGLFISRMIAEAHGGSLTAQSEGKAQGATFVLELPRKE